MKKIVYIAHPISGDIEANLKDLSRILRVINKDCHPLNLPFDVGLLSYNFNDIIPVAPYYADIISLDDNNPLERKRGIENDTALIMTGIFKELWLTGDKISFGMSEEIKLFRLLGYPILDYTNKI